MVICIYIVYCKHFIVNFWWGVHKKLCNTEKKTLGYVIFARTRLKYALNTFFYDDKLQSSLNSSYF